MIADPKNTSPPGWALTTLGEIHFDCTEGINPRRSPDEFYELYSVPSFPSGKPEVVRGRDIGSNKQIVKPGTVLLCGINPRINRAWVIPDASVKRQIASTEWIPFSPVDGLLPEYICYFLRRDDVRDHLASKASGVGGSLMRVKASTCANISFPIAPRAEQRRIVAEIERQFTREEAAVAALKRVQVNLKRYRAAVLKAAVEGRLVPTEAELARAAGRYYEPADQLLQRILAERRARWEAAELAKFRASGKEPTDQGWKSKYKEPVTPDESSLPTLPAGWTWATLSQLSEIQGGIQKQPSRRPAQNPHPFLRVANVLRGRLDLSEVHHIELFRGELEKLRLEAGDLLVVEGNGSPAEIGRMAIWKGEIANCVHQNHIIRARLLGAIPPAYVAAYWNSPEGASRVLDVASSTSGLYTFERQQGRSPPGSSTSTRRAAPHGHRSRAPPFRY
jgi:hypothetical protein